MGSQNVKRSHVIPKFYLRGFCNGQKGQLYAGDLRLQKVFKSNISNAGVVSRFYEEENSLHEDVLESKLSQIESAAAPALARFLAEGSDIVTEVQRLIAWLAARTFWLRRKVSEDLPKWIAANAELLRAGPEENLRLFRFKHADTQSVVNVGLYAALDFVSDPAWRMEVTQDQHLDAIRLQAHMFQAEHFPRLRWTRATAPYGHAFITSDRPVCWGVPGRNVGDYPAALTHPLVELTVPLSRSVALVACRQRKTSCWTADEINLRTCVGAERFVYGHKMDLVERWLRDRSHELAH